MRIKQQRLVAAAIALSCAWGGAMPTGAQTPPPDTDIKLCPAGEIWEFEYMCDPVTLQCHLIKQGCVKA
jgi:hypothetical protein